MNNRFNNKGAIGFVLVLLLMIFSGLVVMLMEKVNREQVAATNLRVNTIAFHLAEAGITKAVYELRKSGGSYTGETNTELGNGTFSVTITKKGADFVVKSTGSVKGTKIPWLTVSIRSLVSGTNYKIIRWYKF
jgi:Tfp pilus assembly protein PilX